MNHPQLGERLVQTQPTVDDLAQLGVEQTPEMLEFVNQIAEAASVGAPLAQPYIASGAIKVFQKQVVPGVTFQAIGFHQTKFAEMLKAPVDNQHLN